MKLENIIKDFTDYRIYGSQEIEINKLSYNSRDVQPGDMFFAQKGLKTDGHIFIKKVMDAGAKCIVLENEDYLSDEICDKRKLTKIKVKNSSKAMAMAANAFYEYPVKDMKMIGITGTNGKTTISYLVKSVLEEAGEKVGVIGTINYLIGDELIEAPKTTPESITLFELFSRMKSEKVTAVVMEVSSHSLALDRVFGLKFDVAAFTNLTQDHLDFHINFDDYFKAKKILFDINLKKEGTAVYNNDDPHGRKIASDFPGKKISYSLESGDVIGDLINLNFDGIELKIQYKKTINTLNSKLSGKFNAYNLLTAASVAFSLDINPAIIVAGLEKVANIAGRFQKLESKNGYYAIVDYSHTPDSLYNSLITIEEILRQQKHSGKIITVFGCGGDRDKTKRPEMGRIASEKSDTIIITNDNPRSEEPRVIIEGILSGIDETEKVEVIEDRKKAIEFALESARSGDIVLVAGKGHENYQEIKGIKHHFDDSEIIMEYFNKE